MSSFIKQILLLLLLLGLSSSFCLAQKVQQLEFEHITQEQGLSQSNVVTIHQDFKGFMWFGTRDGLNKYDGYKFTVYKNDLDDSTSITGNDVRDILEDRDGNLWIATFSGLNKYNREKDNFTHILNGAGPYSISNNLVTCLYEDSRGDIWVGTDEGLNKIDQENKTVTQYLPVPENPDSLSHEHVISITEDQQGDMWVGTYNGLNKLDISEEKFTRYFYSSTENSSGSNRISALFTSSNGQIWVGTRGGGLVTLDSQTSDFTRYEHQEDSESGISHDVILSINEDSKGRLWIGTENGGLNIFDPDKENFSVHKYDKNVDESISNNSIYSILRDNRNNMWLGTYSGGINFYDSNAKKFVHYHNRTGDPTSLNDNNVTDIDEDSQGNIWLSTDGGGITKMDPQDGIFKSFINEPGNSNSIAGNYVLGIEVDHKDNVWAGTWGDGVSRYNTATNTFKHFYPDPNDPQSLGLNNIADIFEDSRAGIWISTVGEGINYLPPNNEDQFVHYKTDPENPHAITDDYPVLTYEDQRHNLWIGTEAVGLFFFEREEERFIHFSQQKNDSTSIRGKKVFDMLHDSIGRLWIATDNGLNRFDYSDSTFSAITMEDGLPTNVVKSILEDESGNFWLGTNKGLSKFNPADTTFSNFMPTDGLQGNEFNGNSALKARNGKMYFGGINGLNVFHPDSIQKNSYIPPVVITDFKIFNKSVGIGKDSELQKQITETDRITLSHKQSVFSFEFAALNYTGTEKNEYAYKMEGFDKQWHFVGTKRTATYTNLNPGEYTFRVKASNNDGVWNEQGTELAIVITPPFWQTNWFYVLSALFIAGVVFTAYRWKVRSIRQHNAELETKVAERTSELNAKNEHLEDALKDLEDALKELKETRSQLVDKAHKAGMAEVATGVLHNVGNILNSINASTSIINETLENSRIKNIMKANDKLREQIDDIVRNNPDSKLLLEYYLKLEEPLNKEYKRLKTQKDRLQEKVSLINEVVAAQQDFSKAGVITEQVDLKELFESALTLQAGSIERHGLVVKRDYEPVELIELEKPKVMNILFNLLKNAKESMDEAEPDEKLLTVSCWQDEEFVHLSVSDNGHGISDENLKKIFTHGFTTKKKGHGFGLHSSANYMKEMGGKIQVESDGRGEGAAFILSFPRDKNDRTAKTLTNGQEISQNGY